MATYNIVNDLQELAVSYKEKLFHEKRVLRIRIATLEAFNENDDPEDIGHVRLHVQETRNRVRELEQLIEQIQDTIMSIEQEKKKDYWY